MCHLLPKNWKLQFQTRLLISCLLRAVYLALKANQTALMIPGPIISAVKAYFSGCIISAAVDFGLIIALGTGIGQAEPVDTYAYPKDPVHPVSTTATPAGTV